MNKDTLKICGFSVNNGRVSCCGQHYDHIPTVIGKMYGDKVYSLDLSYNKINSLRGLEMFLYLADLVLDNNNLSDNITFPDMPHLTTLSLNNNKICDLEQLLDSLCLQTPALTYLSLLSNRACPDRLSDDQHDDIDYQRYRYYVIYRLPSLRFLDSRRVSSKERAEAMTRGQFARVHRPAEVPPTSPGAPTLQRPRRLPVNLAALGQHKGAYGKSSYKYTGKDSEGNRFIVNNDL